MNIRDNFEADIAEESASDAHSAAARRAYLAELSERQNALYGGVIAEDLARELPTQTAEPPKSVIALRREMYRQHIAQGKAAMAVQQQIAADALEQFRQLKAAVRSDEDALDSLLAAEA